MGTSFPWFISNHPDSEAFVDVTMSLQGFSSCGLHCPPILLHSLWTSDWLFLPLQNLQSWANPRFTHWSSLPQPTLFRLTHDCSVYKFISMAETSPTSPDSRFSHLTDVENWVSRYKGISTLCLGIGRTLTYLYNSPFNFLFQERTTVFCLFLPRI